MNPKVRILLVSQYFPPETGAAQTRMKEFVRGLKASDFDVTILTAMPNYPTGKIFPEYQDKSEVWDSESRILRTSINPFKKKSAVLRLITYLTFFQSSRKGDRKHFPKGSFDIVIGTSPPLFASLAASDIAKRHGAKFIYDIRDLWPDIAVHMGMMSRGSLPYKWLDSISRKIIKRSDRILVTTDSDGHQIVSKGYPEDQVVSIPNGACLKTFKRIKNEEVDKMRDKLALAGKFVIAYSGSMNQGMNDVNTFIPLMEQMQEHKDIVLLLIGDGDNLPFIREAADQKKLDNIQFIEQMPLEVLNMVLNCVDLGLVPRKSLKNEVSGGIPVKMFECWALGIPVLLASDKNSEERVLLENISGGVAVDPGDITGMVDGILKIKNDPAMAHQWGENGKEAVIENFSRQSATEKLVDILKNI